MILPKQQMLKVWDLGIGSGFSKIPLGKRVWCDEENISFGLGFSLNLQKIAASLFLNNIR